QPPADDRKPAMGRGIRLHGRNPGDQWKYARPTSLLWVPAIASRTSKHPSKTGFNRRVNCPVHSRASAGNFPAQRPSEFTPERGQPPGCHVTELDAFLWV